MTPVPTTEIFKQIQAVDPQWDEVRENIYHVISQALLEFPDQDIRNRLVDYCHQEIGFAIIPVFDEKTRLDMNNHELRHLLKLKKDIDKIDAGRIDLNRVQVACQALAQTSGRETVTEIITKIAGKKCKLSDLKPKKLIKIFHEVQYRMAWETVFGKK